MTKKAAAAETEVTLQTAEGEKVTTTLSALEQAVRGNAGGALLELPDLAGGRVVEAYNEALPEVLENILDERTDFEKPRKLILELSFEPAAHGLVMVYVQAKTKLRPRMALGGFAVIARGAQGELFLVEELAGEADHG